MNYQGLKDESMLITPRGLALGPAGWPITFFTPSSDVLTEPRQFAFVFTLWIR